MKQRGQATTELAVGSLVFVTVLLYGIHFAEVGFGMLKAKEAAAFAAHHASGRRTHRFNSSGLAGDTFAPFAPAASGAAATARYGSGWKGVMTEVGAVNVTCSADDTLRFGLLRPTGLNDDTRDALEYLRGIYQPHGGVACRSRAVMSLFGIPSSYAEGGNGFFKEQHALRGTFPVCGVGGPNASGNCPGRLAVLTGDWGLEGPIGSELNKDVPNAIESDTEHYEVNNGPYRDIVRKLFNIAGGETSMATEETGAQTLMRIGAGVHKTDEPMFIDETEFAMSYKGDAEGSGVRIQPRTLKGSVIGGKDLKYQTSGAALDNPLVEWDDDTGRVHGVPRCFLGVYGCKKNPQNPRAAP